MSDLEQLAIQRIKAASEMSLSHYKQPLICTYSGGKDSDVMLELFRRAGIPFEVLNSHTTADAPPTVRHIREVFHQLELDGISCKIVHPTYKGRRTSMWSLIPQKLMPPTRTVRYCCQVLKEQTTNGRYAATGVRWDESMRRAKRMPFEQRGTKGTKFSDETMLLTDNSENRRMTELCMQKKSMIVNPIIDWTNKDIWEYIHTEKIPVCELYQCGYTRVGCVGCPMAGNRRYKEFRDFPAYKLNYIRAFDRMLSFRQAHGVDTYTWETGEDVFRWWMNDENIEGQMELEDYISDLNGGESE